MHFLPGQIGFAPPMNSEEINPTLHYLNPYLSYHYLISTLPTRPYPCLILPTPTVLHLTLLHLFISLLYPSVKWIWNRVDCQHSEKRSKTHKRLKRMLFNWTKQDKTCFAYPHHLSLDFILSWTQRTLTPPYVILFPPYSTVILSPPYLPDLIPTLPPP